MEPRWFQPCQLSWLAGTLPPHNSRGWVYACALAHVVCGYVTCGAFMLQHGFFQGHVQLKYETSDFDSAQHVSVSSFRLWLPAPTVFCVRIHFAMILIHTAHWHILPFLYTNKLFNILFDDNILQLEINNLVMSVRWIIYEFLLLQRTKYCTMYSYYQFLYVTLFYILFLYSTDMS